MKIIKHGNAYKKNPVVRFTCHICGCEFVMRGNECEYLDSSMSWRQWLYRHHYPECGELLDGRKLTEASAYGVDCGGTL